MASTKSTPATLLDLIGSAPADRTAIIIPEQNIRVSYGSLRRQVQDVADQLSVAGICRGDRVSTALPNGLPAAIAPISLSLDMPAPQAQGESRAGPFMTLWLAPA